MNVIGGLRRSGLARLGMYALVVLLYVVYVLATLLEFGFGGLGLEPIARRIVGASGIFIIALAILRWFFETKVES